MNPLRSSSSMNDEPAMGRSEIRICEGDDLPDGQISDLAVQPLLKKNSTSPVGQIKTITIAVPSHSEGRIMIVTDVGMGCGGR
jgi:hypothetical protein